MIAGISLTCFAASYSVALALEASRLLFRSAIRSAVLWAFVIAGLFAHTLYLAYRAVQAQASPLASEYDWFLLAAWGLAVVYAILAFRTPRTPVGLLLLPLVLGLIALAALAADPTPYARPEATRAWGAIHGSTLLLGALAAMVGFAAGWMYLWQAWRLKHKQLEPARFPLPSLERLQHVNTQSLFYSAVLWGAGFLSSVLLNLQTPQRLRWTDPLVLTSGVLCAWTAAAALFNAFYAPARQGRKTAYLTLTTFVILVLVLGSLLAFSSHGASALPATGLFSAFLQGAPV